MTDMQLEYNKYRETVKHNRAMEAQNQAELEESRRTHLVYENLERGKLEETIRHQIAQDTEVMRNHMVTEAEIAKHNRATEQIAYAEQAMKERINAASIASNQLIAKWSNATSIERQELISETEKKISELQKNANVYIAKMKDLREKQQIELNGKYFNLEEGHIVRADMNDTKRANAYVANQWASAEAALDQAKAALQNADTTKDLSTSQKAANWGKALYSAVSAGAKVIDVVRAPISNIAEALGSEGPLDGMLFPSLD